MVIRGCQRVLRRAGALGLLAAVMGCSSLVGASAQISVNQALKAATG